LLYKALKRWKQKQSIFVIVFFKLAYASSSKLQDYSIAFCKTAVNAMKVLSILVLAAINARIAY